jgi:hypothetical protein
VLRQLQQSKDVPKSSFPKSLSGIQEAIWIPDKDFGNDGLLTRQSAVFVNAPAYHRLTNRAPHVKMSIRHLNPNVSFAAEGEKPSSNELRVARNLSNTLA